MFYLLFVNSIMQFMACKLDSSMMMKISSLLNYNSLTQYNMRRYLFGPTSEFARMNASSPMKR